MKIKKGLENQFIEFKNNNQDFYGKGVVDYAIRWADLLEKVDVLTYGVAEGCAGKADTEGVSGAMYGFAKSILYTYWFKGEELKNIYIKHKQEEYKHLGIKEYENNTREE